MRIVAVLVLAGAGIYFGLTYSWTAQTNEADSAARPLKALERFDTSNAIIPVNRILAGGPEPDGIPSIDKPKFVTVSDVDFLKDKDEVTVYSADGQSQIYPLRILVWHEVVNDQIGDRAVAVTYCPLCGTAMVLDRMLDGEVLTFGISGLLYNSGVLLFDRQTDSLWTQLGRKGVSGEHVGRELRWLPSDQLTWAEAKKKYSDAQVLSLETGYNKHYDSEAYVEYKNDPRNTFPVKFTRDDFERKAWVLGIEINGRAKAYSIASLAEVKQVDDQIDQTKISITYDAETKLASVTNLETHEPVPSVRSYWFAWQAFYPETLVWQAER